MKGCRQPLDTGCGSVAKVNTRLVTAHQDAFDAELSAQEPELGVREERLRGRGEWPEPVAELGSQRLDIGYVGCPRKPSIEVELGVVRGYVVIREIVRHVHRDIRWNELGSRISPEQSLYALVKHSEIEVEADRLDKTRLLGAEEIPRSAQLHVLQRDAVAGAELGVML